MVTIVQDGLDFGPNPPFSFREDIGNLPAGNYDLEITLVRASFYGNAVFNQTLVVAPAAPLVVDKAIEFHSDSLGQYFVTSNAAEIQDLDDGVHSGWARTGQQ